jgi:hypothetical protein
VNAEFTSSGFTSVRDEQIICDVFQSISKGRIEFVLYNNKRNITIEAFETLTRIYKFTLLNTTHQYNFGKLMKQQKQLIKQKQEIDNKIEQMQRFIVNEEV